MVLTRKLRLGQGQQLNSSLEVNLVLDMVSHLSKAGGDCFVLNKSVVRKKKKFFKTLTKLFFFCWLHFLIHKIKVLSWITLT